MRKLLSIVIFLLSALTARAGFEVPMSISELLAQTDVVVVGRLTKVEKWAVDQIDYGEGTIQVTEVLFGVTYTKNLTLRWENQQYTSGRLDFEDTGGTQYVWLLWRARDGTFRVRHSHQKAPLKERSEIVPAIEKMKAGHEGGSARSAPAPGSKPESDDRPQSKPKPAPR